MDKKQVANSLVALAREIVADQSLVDSMIPKRELDRMMGSMKYDTWKLMMSVVGELKKRLPSNDPTAKGLLLLKDMVDNGFRDDEAYENLRQIADKLGIKVPNKTGIR